MKYYKFVQEGRKPCHVSVDDYMTIKEVYKACVESGNMTEDYYKFYILTESQFRNRKQTTVEILDID